MTYEEYKNTKEVKKSKLSIIIRRFLNKLFTIIIFSMLIITISNHSPKFKDFIVNKVLNDTMDFSYFNGLVNKITNIFKSEEVMKVDLQVNEISHEKYLDGIKYIVGENEEVKIKDSGIVTYIGEKEGYNNTIIIQQSNGYYAWYGNVKENIKLYDYIEKGTTIGYADKEYYYVLLKDDKPININES